MLLISSPFAIRKEKMMRSYILGLLSLCLPLSFASAGELSGTLKRISDSGQINLGYRVSEAPMSFHDPNGNPVGYSIDLCNLIATAVKQKLGQPEITINYLPVTAETRFDAIASGKIDLLCGATTKTLKRSERVSFSQLTFATGGSLLSLKDTEVNGVSALAGKKVAVVANTTTIETLKAVVKKQLVDVKIVPVSDAANGMKMLDSGEVNAFASDQVVLIGQVIARNSGKEYALSKQLFSFEPFALALARGDADFRLAVDRVLSRINRTRHIRKIYAKWFGRFGEKPSPALLALFQLNATPE
jgi:ABC-type amino acid transport substrate-binding protein